MTRPTALTVRDATRALLRQLDLTTVFGNPGSTEAAFLSDWQDDFDYIRALQEASAVSMADGYAQFSPARAALVLLHSDGGVGHAMGAIASAAKNHAPLVILAGQQARALLAGEPFLGSAAPTLLPQPYVKWATQPARPQDVPDAILRAYLTATTPPFGPALVSIPADDWHQPGHAVQARPRPGGLAPVLDALTSSHAPALVLGADVDTDTAADLAVALAETLDAHVWASPMSGRCSFPERHRLFAGFLEPTRNRIGTALEPYDTVLVIGTSAFVQHVHTDPGPDWPSIHLITADPTELAWSSCATRTLATPANALRTILDHLDPDLDRIPRPAPLGAIRTAATAAPPVIDEPVATHTAAPISVPARVSAGRVLAHPPTPSGLITAEYALSVLSELLPPSAIVVEEAPSHRPALHRHLPLHPGSFLTGQAGILGYALPAAIGAALAQPQRPVVALIGDGSIHYTIQALYTAVEQHTHTIIVIMDNGQYGAVRALAEGAGEHNVPGLDLPGIHFASLAAGYGCPAHEVSAPELLAPTLAKALNEPAPVLIHVLLDPQGEQLYGEPPAHAAHTTPTSAGTPCASRTGTPHAGR